MVGANGEITMLVNGDPGGGTIGDGASAFMVGITNDPVVLMTTATRR